MKAILKQLFIFLSCMLSIDKSPKCLVVLLDKPSYQISEITNILNTNKIGHNILHLYDHIHINKDSDKINIPRFSTSDFESNKIPSSVSQMVQLFEEANFIIFIQDSKSHIINSNLILILEWFSEAYNRNIVETKFNIMLSFGSTPRNIDYNTLKATYLISLFNKMKSTNLKGYLQINNTNKMIANNDKFDISPSDQKRIEEYILYAQKLSNFK